MILGKSFPLRFGSGRVTSLLHLLKGTFTPIYFDLAQYQTSFYNKQIKKHLGLVRVRMQIL